MVEGNTNVDDEQAPEEVAPLCFLGSSGGSLVQPDGAGQLASLRKYRLKHCEAEVSECYQCLHM